MLGDREMAGLSPRTFPSPDLCRAHGRHRCTFVKTMGMLNNYLLVASWGEACAALDSHQQLPTRWVTLFSKTALPTPNLHHTPWPLAIKPFLCFTCNDRSLVALTN